ncbi:MAG: substrate-binding domain-containing protein [Spirochaetes bacterium]|nr:substrate-binding domain-containing protein [Spirochaetota bacterium]MBN2770731.1 substrate-binding domain-containing protein [Spirochaetota bacterium]
MSKSSSSKPLKIGVMFPGLFSEYEKCIYHYSMNSVIERGHNFFALVSGLTQLFAKSFNIRKDALAKMFEGLDGAIVITSPLFNHTTDLNKVASFLETITVPVVSVGLPIPGKPSVIIDNSSGLSDAITHLVKFHNKKNIGYIMGNCNNPDSADRLKIFKDVMGALGLPSPDNYITTGDLCSEIPQEELATLLERTDNKLDAIVCSNDAIAAKVVNEAKNLNIDIPKQIAITGFDNSYDRGLTDIPISSVRQPLDQAMDEAVLLIEKAIAGDKKSTHLRLNTSFIARRSCGCFFPPDETDTLNATSIQNREDIFNFIKHQLSRNTHKSIDDKLIKEWALSFIEARSICTTDNYVSIITLFETMVYEGVHLGIDASHMFRILIGIINISKSSLSSDTANNLFHHAGRIIEEMAIQTKIRERRTIHSHYKTLYAITEAFANITNNQELKHACMEAFHLAGISNFAIFLYSESNTDEVFFTSYATINGQPIEKDYTGHNLKSMYSAADFGKNCPSVLLPIFGEHHDLGYLIISDDRYDGIFYHILSILISNALKTVELIQTINNHTITLEQQITERTHELEDVNQQLQNLDSLKNDFIANITHDFKSPLSVVINMAELCLETGRYSDRNFELIHQASLKLKTTVDRLLNLARMDAKGIELHLGDFDILKLVTRVSDFFRSTIIETGIDICISADQKLNWMIHSDEEKIEDVINNIVSNAVKFVNPDNGKIIISLSQSLDQITIDIRDNGIGIEPDMLDTIFRRFEQAEEGKKRRYRGTGIGLDFSKQLISFLKGKISAQSEGKNKGACFTIEIPVDSQKSAVPGQTDNRDAQETSIPAKESVIYNIKNLNTSKEYDITKALFCVISPETDTQQTIKNHLNRNGYHNIIQIEDSSKAFDVIRKNNPDIIICELISTDLCRQINSDPETESTPLLLLTRIKEKRLLRSLSENGISALLLKPVNETELIGLVKYHIKNNFLIRKLLNSN